MSARALSVAGGLIAVALLMVSAPVSAQGGPSTARLCRAAGGLPTLSLADAHLMRRVARRALEAPGSPFEEVVRARDVMVVRDVAGALDAAGGLLSPGGWQLVLAQLYATHPDAFDLVVAFVASPEPRVAALYTPLANDVEGIGVEHVDGRGLFDDSETEVDGLIFLNDYHIYLGSSAALMRGVFLHEVGHRWGAMVHYEQGGAEYADILGRDGSHWSFFLDSRGSSLEGNSWRDNGDGTFTTESHLGGARPYSDLDLYLMGFLPAAQVDDFFLITEADVGGQRDEWGDPITASSGPAMLQAVTVSGRRRDISIGDVQGLEGPRVPDFESSQKVWRVATVVVLEAATPFDNGDLQRLAQLLDGWEVQFEEATFGVADMQMVMEASPQVATADLGEPCVTPFDCDPEQGDRCEAIDGELRCTRRCAGGDCGALCCDGLRCVPADSPGCPAELADAGSNWDAGLEVADRGPREPPAGGSDGGCQVAPWPRAPSWPMLSWITAGLLLVGLRWRTTRRSAARG